jgi:hypothetical protein
LLTFQVGYHRCVYYDCRQCFCTGWSIFDKLYIFKGVVYIVTDEPSTIPNVTDIYSKGLFIENGDAAVLSRLPTDEDIRIISTKQANKLFGSGAFIMDGVTVRFIFVPNQPKVFTLL